MYTAVNSPCNINEYKQTEITSKQLVQSTAGFRQFVFYVFFLTLALNSGMHIFPENKTWIYDG